MKRSPVTARHASASINANTPRRRASRIPIKLNHGEIDLICSFLIGSLEADTLGASFSGDAATAIQQWRAQRSSYVAQNYSIHSAESRDTIVNNLRSHDEEAALLKRLHRFLEQAPHGKSVGGEVGHA